MITEKGTVKTSVKIDENLTNELNKTSRNLGILYVVAGIIIFVCGVVITVIDTLEGSSDNIAYIEFLLAALFIGLGIFMFIYTKNLNKMLLKMNRMQEIEFLDGYLLVREYTDGEHTATSKIYYKWLSRIKETKNYLFLFNSRVTALAVDKNSLPLNELNAVRILLGRAPQGAPAQNVQSNANSAASQVPPAEPAKEVTQEPADPFAEMTENKDNKEE